MGWQWIRHLAEHHDLWVMTEANRFAPVLRERVQTDAALAGKIEVIGVARERRGERIAGAIAYYRTYYEWHCSALRKARELHEQLGFDLVHQLNMIGYREPGELRKLGLPLVWGPIGGHAQMPAAYLLAMGARGALGLAMRNAANAIQMRFSSRVRETASAARVLIAATSADSAALQRFHGRNAELINETGAGEVRASVRRKAAGAPLKVLWCGLLAPRKGITLALRAIAEAKGSIDIRFTVLGRGPAEGLARRLARELRLDAGCSFAGHLPREEVMREMHEHHVLLFPSLQEGTPHAVLEALATGLPVACHAICGQGDVVNAECGITVPVSTPRRSIEAFAQGLVSLGRSPAHLAALSRGAAQRASQLSWSAKAQRMSDLYFTALAASPFASRSAALRTATQ
jgi:hypothetical protein